MHIQTVPAQLMGAFSADMPCISLVTGPMLTGSYSGRRVGACTDCRAIWKDFRADLIDIEELVMANNALVPTVGVSTYLILFLLLNAEFHLDLWRHG
jgi:dihydroxy-acid dehydratase